MENTDRKVPENLVIGYGDPFHIFWIITSPQHKAAKPLKAQKASDLVA